jgi:hypothetical protein
VKVSQLCLDTGLMSPEDLRKPSHLNWQIDENNGSSVQERCHFNNYRFKVASLVNNHSYINSDMIIIMT